MKRYAPSDMPPKFLPCLLPGADRLQLQDYEMALDSSQLTLKASSTQASACCPLCSHPSQRVHSRYERTLADLPCVSFNLTLVLEVGKFFCDRQGCHRRIFSERLPEVAAPWARKTVRLVQRLQTIGLALGGAAGARLSHQVGARVCGSTLLNHLRKLTLPEFETPKLLGVDDFAFRKGSHYGTILVDLERHQPVALLPDRKGETLARWLQHHPGVQVLSRDRARADRSGTTCGAPEAVQVADRFHLVQNLRETLEQVLAHYAPQLNECERQQRQAGATAGTVAVIPKPTATVPARTRTQEIHQQRVQQQRQLRQLHQQGWSQSAIARETGVSVRTVRRLLSLPELPPTPTRRRSFGRSLLDPYKQPFLEWWNAGIRQPQELMVLLQEKGYTGSLRTLTRYISAVREAQGLPPTRVQLPQNLPRVSEPQSPPLTVRRAAYLILKRPERRDSEESNLLEGLGAQHPTLALVVGLAEEFLQLLRQPTPEALDPWLRKAVSSSLSPLQSFAEGLLADYAAVKASLMFPVSNGPVEGLNNRLKMLKRQMYGRAGLELLSKRFILAQ